jgi:hypothetical protein
MSTLALVIADTSQHLLGRIALQRSLQGLDVSQVLIYSDRAEAWPGMPVQLIAPLQGIGAYNRLITQRLAQDLRADHALVVQYDGFVLDAAEFSPHFRHYDYIGAPWPHLPDTPVGNGGFSWRSRRLVEAVARLPYDGESEAEDLFICRSARPALAQQGLRWAPPALAAHFSVESVPVPHPTFGFHGVFHLPAVYRENTAVLLQHLAPRTLQKWAPLLRPAFVRLGVQELAAYEARLAEIEAVATA